MIHRNTVFPEFEWRQYSIFFTIFICSTKRKGNSRRKRKTKTTVVTITGTPKMSYQRRSLPTTPITWSGSDQNYNNGRTTGSLRTISAKEDSFGFSVGTREQDDSYLNSLAQLSAADSANVWNEFKPTTDLYESIPDRFLAETRQTSPPQAVYSTPNRNRRRRHDQYAVVYDNRQEKSIQDRQQKSDGNRTPPLPEIIH